jgi:serine/threonine-protein phosphatase 2A regulatory subunit B
VAFAVFEETDESAASSYFGEIIASVSDIQFTLDGRYIISRDYMSIKVSVPLCAAIRLIFRTHFDQLGLSTRTKKGHPCIRRCHHPFLSFQIWDIAMESRPVRTIPVHEYLRPKLADLYENDCIFDKFQVACSGDARSLMTGSYNNCFKLYNTVDNTEVTIELSKARPKPPVVRHIDGVPSGDAAMAGGPDFSSVPPVVVGEIDFTKKVLHYSWHATEDIVAVAGLNNLYIYHA